MWPACSRAGRSPGGRLLVREQNPTAVTKVPKLCAVNIFDYAVVWVEYDARSLPGGRVRELTAKLWCALAFKWKSIRARLACGAPANLAEVVKFPWILLLGERCWACIVKL